MAIRTYAALNVTDEIDHEVIDPEGEDDIVEEETSEVVGPTSKN